MKKIVFLSILLFLSATFYVNGQENNSSGSGYNKGNGNGNGKNEIGYGQTSNPAAGATLNVGIILLALGGVGVAYYVREKIALK
jgi:hypothetical protein